MHLKKIIVNSITNIINHLQRSQDYGIQARTKDEKVEGEWLKKTNS